MDFEDYETVKSWQGMVNHMLDSLFMTRQQLINCGSSTAEDADKYITEKSKEYLSKYEEMDADEIDKKIEAEIVSMLLKRLRG